jgi:predicted nuclease with TOPRIM domain
LEEEQQKLRSFLTEVVRERDRMWAETQRLAQHWETQKAYIENQQARLESLQQQVIQVEQERDQVWAEAQRLAQHWEEQKAYIESQNAYIQQLEAGLVGRLAQRVRRLGHHVWRWRNG